MDLVLSIFDDYIFDRFWARVVPLAAFSQPPDLFATVTVNTSAYIPGPSSPKWFQLVSHLPHPPINQSDFQLQYIPNASAWPRDYIPRQIMSLIMLTLVGIHILYFLFASLSYRYIFNHEMMRHPRFLKNQVKLEIESSLRAFPAITFLTLPWFQAEVMGYSRLYDGLDTYGYFYLFASVPLFLLFTDYSIYWIHRWLHIPIFYKHIHKPHHKWIIPTPYSSHAFHPIDGYLQSIPYHLFVFLFPFHRVLYIVLFVLVNMWSIFIHDSDMITGHPLETLINGPAHHTLHHLYFTVNYGQYFTWADRFCGSYRQPESSLDPLLEVKQSKAE